MVSWYTMCYYDLIIVLTYAIQKLEHNLQMRRHIFAKSVSSISADPEEQVGAKNSISPKNDLRSFCTNVTIYKCCVNKTKRVFSKVQPDFMVTMYFCHCANLF